MLALISNKAQVSKGSLVADGFTRMCVCRELHLLHSYGGNKPILDGNNSLIGIGYAASN